MYAILPPPVFDQALFVRLAAVCYDSHVVCFARNGGCLGIIDFAHFNDTRLP